MAADNAVAVKTAAAGRSLHGLGVICGLAAGVWLGAAEAPTKLVNAGFSPFAVSLCMVAGVFTARWTFPTLLKGTSYVFADLLAKKHLIVWAILAGALWAVANTLTVFAIRDVGLATAFPLWNTNSLIGLLWGVLLFRELQGAPAKNIVKVVCGAICIVGAAIMLGFSTIQDAAGASPHAFRGLLSAAGASLMWGTMYVPYRKAYLSGMNPLSFVTAFTAGEPVAPEQAVALLAVPGRLRVGDRRSLSAVRHQIFRDRARHSSVEYEPVLGTGLGCAGVWRTGHGEPGASCPGCGRVGAYDPGGAGHQHGGGFVSRDYVA